MEQRLTPGPLPVLAQPTSCDTLAAPLLGWHCAPSHQVLEGAGWGLVAWGCSCKVPLAGQNGSVAPRPLQGLSWTQWTGKELCRAVLRLTPGHVSNAYFPPLHEKRSQVTARIFFSGAQLCKSLHKEELAELFNAKLNQEAAAFLQKGGGAASPPPSPPRPLGI